MFDLGPVHTFVAVAKVKHFGKAAEMLNATQPGVSQHIAKLERQLGIKLISRTKRSVELTPAGEVFLDHAHRLLPMLQRMEDDSRRVAAGLLGKVSLGFSSSIIYSDVPQQITAFRDETPGVELLYQVHGGDELKSLLDWGQVDAIVTTLPMTSKEYWSIAISQQELGIAIQSNHKLAGRRRLKLEALRHEPFIMVPRAHHPRNHDALISRFREFGAELTVASYETSFPNVLTRVAMGEGVALVAVGYRGDRSDVVRIIDLDDPLLSTTPIYLVARHDNVRMTTRKLIDYLAGRQEPGGTGASTKQLQRKKPS